MRILSFLLCLLLPVSLFAESSTHGGDSTVVGQKARTIKILGRNSSVVSSKDISLGDVARVSSRRIADDDAIISLRRIVVASSPAPGEKLTLSASQVLERLREGGVQLDSIGYAFPRIMTVERAARTISLLEIETVVKEAMPDDGDSELVEVLYKEPVRVAPGAVALSAKILPSNKQGQYTAKILAQVEGETAVRFNVPLAVKEWVEVPVAKRPLPRGSVVSSSDMVMARADLSEVPVDAAREVEQIVGYETTHAIGYGEVFRKKKLSIPPVVARGSQVTILYKTALLEATAAGTALEDGVEGQRISVRNDASRKTVSGEVVQPGLVRVNP